MNKALKKKSKQSLLNKHTHGDKIFYFFVYTFINLLTLSVLYPLIYILASSFSSPSAVLAGKVFIWPVEFTLMGYERVFSNPNVWLGYRNTIFYTIVGTSINIFFTLTCAYPLARKGLPYRSFITRIFVFTMLFSGGMIPTYLLVRSLKMINTAWALLIPGAMAAYQMIVTRTFISSTIPDEMLEAAQIDGCNDFAYFFRFILPLSKPVISVIAMQYAVQHWNSYMNAFIYLNEKRLYPLQVFLREVLVLSKVSIDTILDEDMQTVIGLSEVIKYSLIVASTVPILMVYPFIQKYFVKGIMIGSVKG